MADFAHPGQKGGPSLVVAPWQRGGGELVGAADIPPIRRDPPDQPQTCGRLQRDRSTAGTGGIEAGLFVLLGCPARAVVYIRGGCGASSIARHAAFIAKSALSGSVVARHDFSLNQNARHRNTSALAVRPPLPSSELARLRARAL
jgi:hypothetical protein